MEDKVELHIEEYCRKNGWDVSDTNTIDPRISELAKDDAIVHTAMAAADAGVSENEVIVGMILALSKANRDLMKMHTKAILNQAHPVYIATSEGLTELVPVEVEI